MRKQLTICCAFALAACSSAPSESDIEELMQRTFASCQNVMLKDVKKTNGYEDDGHYTVEFSYSLKVKNPKQLRNKKEQLIKEIEQKNQASSSLSEISQIASDMEHELQNLEWAGYPKMIEFDRRYPHLSADEKANLLSAAQAEYARNPPAELLQKRQELKAKKDALEAQRTSFPRLEIVGNIGSVVENFYQAGCSQTARRFMRPLVSAPREAANAENDQTRWFDEYDIDMTAKIPMRKTEAGWRALSN